MQILETAHRLLRHTGIVWSLLTLSGGAAMATQPPDRVVRDYLAARTPAARMRFLAPSYRFWFMTREGSGKTAAEHLKPGWDSELHDTLRPDSIGVDGDHVVARVHEDNDFSRLIGHPGWDATITFTIDDRGRIATEFYEPRPGAPSWRPYLDAALPWLQQHRSAALARTFPGGRLVETRASARAWRSMLRDWRRAVGRQRAIAH